MLARGYRGRNRCDQRNAFPMCLSLILFHECAAIARNREDRWNQKLLATMVEMMAEFTTTERRRPQARYATGQRPLQNNKLRSYTGRR
jgi:hypothetical protein